MANLTDIWKINTLDRFMLDAHTGSYLIEQASLMDTEDEHRDMYLSDSFNLLSAVRIGTDNTEEEMGAGYFNGFMKTLVNCFNEHLHLSTSDDKEYDTEFINALVTVDDVPVNTDEPFMKLYIAATLLELHSSSNESNDTSEMYIHEALDLIGDTRGYAYSDPKKELTELLTSSADNILSAYIKRLTKNAEKQMADKPDVKDLMGSIAWAYDMSMLSILMDDGTMKIEAANRAVNLRSQIGKLTSDSTKYTDSDDQFDNFRIQYNLLKEKANHALELAQK